MQQQEDLGDAGSLIEQGDAFTRAALAAAQVGSEAGSDVTGSVTVRLDVQGLVGEVTVTAGWRDQLSVEDLPAAVVEAVRDAVMQRMSAWAQAYGAASEVTPVAAAAATPEVWDRAEFQRRLQEVSTAPMSEQDRLAALTGLLELVEGIEQGLDEVTGKVGSALSAAHTGHSRDRRVSVTLTGAGEVVAVRFDRAWLRQAHEANIGRQTNAAFRAAYEKRAQRGVDQLIADSPLGRAQRATQDPLSLARRLRLAP